MTIMYELEPGDIRGIRLLGRISVFIPYDLYDLSPLRPLDFIVGRIYNREKIKDEL